MNEEEKMSAQCQESPAPQDPAQQLSPRRRSALVTYLAVLFAVAFLFVAVMMVAETKRLKTMNEEMKESSQKTSASLTNNINALQAENQKLSKANDELNGRIEELEEAAVAAETELAGLQAEIDRLNQEAAAREAAHAEELGAVQIQLAELEHRAEDAVRVSELLQEALVVNDEGDLEKLQELLDQIEELKELLSPTEAEIYEELKIA